jgi:hypothetical protein
MEVRGQLHAPSALPPTGTEVFCLLHIVQDDSELQAAPNPLGFYARHEDAWLEVYRSLFIWLRD